MCLSLSTPLLHTASNQKPDGGKTWEHGWSEFKLDGGKTWEHGWSEFKLDGGKTWEHGWSEFKLDGGKTWEHGRSEFKAKNAIKNWIVGKPCMRTRLLHTHHTSFHGIRHLYTLPPVYTLYYVIVPRFVGSTYYTHTTVRVMFPGSLVPRPYPVAFVSLL